MYYLRRHFHSIEEVLLRQIRMTGSRSTQNSLDTPKKFLRVLVGFYIRPVAWWGGGVSKSLL